MLSCMAAKLYWLARYVDLADFVAQNIKTSQHLAALPASYFRTGTELECALGTAQVSGRRAAVPRRPVSSVILTMGPDNPSSKQRHRKFLGPSCNELITTFVEGKTAWGE